MILSRARSNRDRKVFLIPDARRLNVEHIRARFCLIIVGDSSTLCQKKVMLFQSLRDDARSGNHGGMFELKKPSKDVDLTQLRRYESMKVKDGV